MTGIHFNYEVRVRELTYGTKRNIFSGSWYGFSTIADAIRFCATNSPYEQGEQPALKRDWIIQVTLQGIILEMLSPADWQSLFEPEWRHPQGLIRPKYLKERGKQQ